jgi:endonuclease/exonuclease/phosphatase family metal-dependent hydrolase
LARVALRVLIWNLMHGRSVPGAGRDLLAEFTAALGSWEWDVALLQEVPPWWPRDLGLRLGADWRLVPTSRNAFLPLRRAIAVRAPDVSKSNGGGANAILARPPGHIRRHLTLRLCRLPERRMLQAVRLESGVWVGNLHASVRNDAGARREAALAARTVLAWSEGAPVVLGGDFNVRGLALDGFEQMARSDVDYVFAAGWNAGGLSQVLPHGRLSDHAPLAVTLTAER